MSSLSKLMTEHGFYLGSTGGGCTAYARLESDGTAILITGAGDVDAPTRLTQRVTIGRYSQEGKPLFSVASSVPEALRSL